ncbi:MAG TPA: dCTP deaminase [Ktedonobacterales bacterium]|nr:dCTP deaminase [Ktedonobacterales bacterium]
MILSDRDVRARLARGDIKIAPEPDPEIQIQPASIDLRLGYDFQTFNYTQQALIDPANPSSFEQLTHLIHLQESERFIVHPGEFVLATTLEHVEIPDDLVARLEGRSSIGRLGIVIHSTAGYIDPGFKGRITLEISNLGRIAVALYPGMRICQIAFEEMSSPVSESYGAKRTAKYQGQQTTTLSRLFEDDELRNRRLR